MKHCPNCFCEFVDRIEICTDCGTKLVKGQPTEDNRLFWRIHINPNKYKVIKNLLLIVFLLIIIPTAISIYIIRDISKIQIVWLLLSLVIFIAFMKKNRELSFYQKMKKNGFGQNGIKESGQPQPTQTCSPPSHQPTKSTPPSITADSFSQSIDIEQNKDLTNINQQEQLIDSFLENINNLKNTVDQLEKQKTRLSQDAASIIDKMKESYTTLQEGIVPMGESSDNDRLNIAIDPNKINQSTDNLLELLKNLGQTTDDSETKRLLNVLDDNMSKVTMGLMYLQM